MVSDGQTGLLFEAGDARDLASKAAWMWEHPRDARAMGSASYKVFQERFQPEHCYRILVGVYETLIRSK
jgi:glycosyltransferase involved in cell wall biosynthesis